MKLFFKRLIIVIVLVLLALGWLLQVHGQNFRWIPSPNAGVQGYILMHGTASHAYGDFYNAGNGTNFILTNARPIGLNYFNIAALIYTNGMLLASAETNEIVITNLAGVELSSVTLTSTDLVTWTPWHTNHFIFPTTGNRFFKSGGVAINNTNILLLPPLPPTP